MSTETLKSFAEFLVNQRKEKNITLNQVANRTRIDIKYLKAIEEANFEIMPDVYMRAFIKSYAQTVDQDPEETLKTFDLAKSGKTISKEPELVTEEKKDQPKKIITIESEIKTASEENKKKNNSSSIIFGIVGGVIIIAAVLVYFLVFQKGSTEIVKEKPFTQILEEKSRFEVTETKKEEEIVVPVIVDSLYLKFEAKDTCWVKALKDDQITQEFLLYPNRSKTIVASSKFNLLIGNSNGVTLYLNDKILTLDDKTGRLPNVEITLDTIESINKEIEFTDESKDSQ